VNHVWLIFPHLSIFRSYISGTFTHILLIFTGVHFKDKFKINVPKIDISYYFPEFILYEALACAMMCILLRVGFDFHLPTHNPDFTHCVYDPPSALTHSPPSAS